MTIRYSEDKPNDCEHCYFWNARKKKCKFPECYYVLKKQKRTITMCAGCPYGRVRPCIGWCTCIILGR